MAILWNKYINPNRTKIILNTGWLVLERGIRIGIGFFVTALMARYLGPEKFGILSYAVSIIAILEPIVNLGLNSILKKFFIYYPNKHNEILGSVFLLRLLSTTLLISILLFLIFTLNFSSPSSSIILAILSIGLLFKLFDIIDIWYESQILSKYTSIIKSVSILLSSLLKIVLVYLKAPLFYFAISIVFEAVICTIGYIILLRAQGYHLRSWIISFSILKIILQEGAPLILAGLAVMVYMKIDQVMLLHILGEKAVGIYSVAVKLSEPWSIISVNLVASIFPTLLLAKKKSYSDYYRKLQKLFAYMSMIAIAIIIPTIFISPFLVNKIFGPNYLEAIPILQIHIFGNLFIFWAVAQDPWDITEKQTKFVLGKTLFAAILNILLNLYLIPLYQGVGAAYSTLISYSSICFLNIFHKKARKALILQIRSLFFWRYL